MKKVGYFFLVVILILAGIEYFLYRNVSTFIQRSHDVEKDDPKSMLLSSNDINFRSDDGVDLHGWLIQGKPGFPAIIIAHKYDATRSSSLLTLEGLITSLNKQGYWVF